MQAVLTADYYGNPVPSLQGAEVLKFSADENSVDVTVRLKQYVDPRIVTRRAPLTLHLRQTDILSRAELDAVLPGRPIRIYRY
ncbi:hypothetical protein PY365_09700 [Roseiarcaceae bacterium H3SJ34-1]|uniref:hypothetical protein n=1 Tax=Terripilifer ovatus TaxID=3032367 RepID=UPI003AB9A285|nr:hypothetical protein [Roseiarcaceae bacterium H3SJ34-1]